MTKRFKLAALMLLALALIGLMEAAQAEAVPPDPPECRPDGVKSAHPYRPAGDMPETWTYTCPFQADYIKITFSQDTALIPGDVLCLTDAEGNETCFTGRQLSGASVCMKGNRFSLRLETPMYDEIEEYGGEVFGSTFGFYLRADEISGYTYGFSLSRVTGITEEEYRAPQYTVRNGILTGYSAAVPAGDLVIPGTINGQAVTGIGDYAFYEHGELTSVVLPSGVTALGDSAFYGCSGLTSVSLPAGLTGIGKGAFYGCSSLTAVSFPQGITCIGMDTFADCSGLESVFIQGGVTGIGEYAFCGCSKLASIVLPEGLTSIGSHAFSCCTGLEQITFPQSVTAIGEDAFSFCYGLTSIELPEGAASLGNYAFSNCTGLDRIILPAGLTDIGEGAFISCTGLEAITLPDSLTSIGFYAFMNCSSLRQIVIPNGVTSIGASAFRNCTSLTGVILPANIKAIDSNTFRNCASLGSVTIPEGVTAIWWAAFCQCLNLREVFIPASVTRILDSYSTISSDLGEAFGECPQLTIYGDPGSRALAYAAEHDIPSFSYVEPSVVVQSVARTSGTSTFSIFFTPFAGDVTYQLYASDAASGPYEVVAQGGADLFGCKVIVHGVANGTPVYYRLRGGGTFTCTFSPYEYPMSFRYEEISGGVRITGIYSGNILTEIEVPERIGGLPVTEIAEDAFTMYNKLEKITLPCSLAMFARIITKPNEHTVIEISGPVTSP